MRRSLLLMLAVTSLLVPAAAHAVTPGMRHAEMPDRYGLTYKSVDFTTPDKATISGWWFQGPPHAPAIVLASSGTGTMAGVLPVAAEFSKRGFNVLTFDYRDFGPNGAGPQDSLHYVVRASRWVTDMVAALNFARTKVDTGAAVMAWGGADLSSVVALAASARGYKLADGVVVEGMFPTTDDEMKANGTSVIPEATSAQLGKLDGVDEPRVAATLLRTPLLLVLAARDTLTPPEMTVEVFSRRRNRLDRFNLPTSGHDNVTSAPGYFDRVSAWYRQMSLYVNSRR